jgi:glyceraldehyde-3-phosphate dehydrogenase/erythrose-4-phosphate dehydrogenase
VNEEGRGGSLGVGVAIACMAVICSFFLVIFVLCIAYCRCYQFKYDSTHGRYKGTVEFDDKSHHLIVDGRKIKVYMHPDPTKIPWSEEDVDIVIESSGV